MTDQLKLPEDIYLNHIIPIPSLNGGEHRRIFSLNVVTGKGEEFTIQGPCRDTPEETLDAVVQAAIAVRDHGRFPDAEKTAHVAEHIGFEHAQLTRKLGAKQERIEKALTLAVRYGGINGDHHKAWVIDQMFRVLAGNTYEQRVREACDGEDGPDTYEWDEGIAP